jgi:hypothetical protein
MSNPMLTTFVYTLLPCQPYVCIYQTQKLNHIIHITIESLHISQICNYLCFGNPFIMHVIIGIEPILIHVMSAIPMRSK